MWHGAAAFGAPRSELTPMRTPVGDAWILTHDQAAFHAAPGPAAPARLLSSGDAYSLLRGTDCDLLVPDASQRACRDVPVMTVQPWRWLSRAERGTVTAEALALPLPGTPGRIVARWDD